jgi:dihydroflavonol-4-reductase
MMRILVLGATGFIGGEIVRSACDAGMEMHGLRRRAGAVGNVGDLPVAWHDGDLENCSSLEAAMAGCQVVFNAAAYAPQTQRNIPQANRLAVTQIRNVIQAAKSSGVERMVFTSSLTTIGPPPEGADRLADERDSYLPGSVRNAYYECKWAMEHEALQATLTGLPVIILCPTAVIGPGGGENSPARLVLEVARGRLSFGLDATNNLVDVRDVGLAHVRAATSGTPGERYLIGGHNLHITEALQKVAELAGVKSPKRVVKMQTVDALLQIGTRLGLPIPETIRAIRHWQPLNCEKGWKTFGFTPRPFADTVVDTLAWFKERGYLP